MSGATEGTTEFERRLRERLIESSDALDGRTRSRLTQARHQALAQAGRGRGWGWGWGWGWMAVRSWVPAGAVAMALLVTVLVVQQRGAVVPGQGVVATTQSASTLEDMELLADADGYALSNEAEPQLDADFYEWAAGADGTST